MTFNGYTARNYAAQINGTTVITRAFKKENAVMFTQSKDASVTDKDVYAYEGITGAAPIDEVYNEPVRDRDANGDAYWRDVYKVRLQDECARLVIA